MIDASACESFHKVDITLPVYQIQFNNIVVGVD